MAKKPIAAFAADIHWMSRTPEYRKETCPFQEVTAKKLIVFAKYLRTHSVPGFVAGDVFDISRSFNDWWTLRDVMREHFWPHVQLCVVPGQHDRFHHNANDRMTSLNALFDEAGAAMTNFSGHTAFLDSGHVRVCGAGWGDPIPECDAMPGMLTVLVTHKTLWHRTPVYPGQTEGNVAVEAAKYKALGYDMVFSGDNHKTFDCAIGGVEFHNIGCMTRSDVRYRDQQPRFMVLFDDLSVESVYVGEKDVFDIERSDADKGRDNTKDGFSEALAGGFEHGLTFKGGLEKIAAEGKCGDLEFTETQRSILRDIINAV